MNKSLNVLIASFLLIFFAGCGKDKVDKKTRESPNAEVSAVTTLSSEKPYSKAIAAVLDQDTLVNERNEYSLKNAANLKDKMIIVDIICAAKERIALDGCPKEFVDAYKEHCKAWFDYLIMWGWLLKSINDGVLPPIREITEVEDRTVAAINRTQKAYLDIAAAYGADVSKYRK